MSVTPFTKDDGSIWYKVQVSKRDHDGKRYQRKRICRNQAEAYAVERELLTEIEEIVAGKDNIKWKELVQKYYEHSKRTKAPSTCDRERYSIEAHINPAFNDFPISEITRAMVEDLVMEKLSQKTKSTQKTVLRYVSSIFNYAIDRGYVDKNPCQGMSKLIRVPETKLGILNAEQVQYLLDSARRMNWCWFPHVYTAINTGLRNGELYALRYENVDFERNTITVCEAWSSKTGYQPYTKNREIRVVPMNAGVRELFLQLEPKSEGGFVLPRLVQWDKGEQSREFRAFLRAIGLPEINFHTTRAIFICQMIQNNVPINIVQSVVSHKSLITTMKYVRLTGTEVLGCTDVLNFSLDGNRLREDEDTPISNGFKED